MDMRAPVQGDPQWSLRDGHPAKPDGAKPPGTISWDEHVRVWEAYARRYPSCARLQDAQRMAQRGGFGYAEIVDLTGEVPKTWTEGQ